LTKVNEDTVIDILENEFNVDFSLLDEEQKELLRIDAEEIAGRINRAKKARANTPFEKNRVDKEEIKVITQADALESLGRWKEEQDNKKQGYVCGTCYIGRIQHKL